jgi:hypothetical protein
MGRPGEADLDTVGPRGHGDVDSVHLGVWLTDLAAVVDAGAADHDSFGDEE